MSALRQTLAVPPLSPAEIRFLRTVASDTEDAPWLVINDRPFWNASGLAWTLHTYARAHNLPWHVGAMLPLTYLPPGGRRRKQVAPDVLASLVPVEGRDSYPVEEGMPPFVLEVVSRSSVRRDLEDKTELYRLLGAQEYVIVRLDLATPRLEGYRRAARGVWMAWAPDTHGQLWSDVLGLGLVLRENEVRAVTREGDVLRTPREEAEARARAEEELARLRADLDRLTHGGDETPQ